jgi:hypothetical protein
MSDENLDVELDVSEQPEEAKFPRRPNVISHRGHRLKLNVTIADVPPERPFVTITASVFTYGPERIGEEAHVSRSRELWGEERGRTFEIEPANLPAKLAIVVPKLGGDDHLGQGPYEAIVTVNTSTEPPDDPTLVTGGGEFSIEFTSM